jgi:hypothetical protein
MDEQRAEEAGCWLRSSPGRDGDKLAAMNVQRPAEVGLLVEAARDPPLQHVVQLVEKLWEMVLPSAVDRRKEARRRLVA